MSYSYSSETQREIWDDQHGDCIEVGPDRVALNLVEVRYRTEMGVIVERMAFSPEQARLVARAMISCAQEIEEGE